MMNVSWSKPSNHFTALFEARVINWLKVASIYSRAADGSFQSLPGLGLICYGCKPYAYAILS